MPLKLQPRLLRGRNTKTHKKEVFGILFLVKFRVLVFLPAGRLVGGRNKTFYTELMFSSKVGFAEKVKFLLIFNSKIFTQVLFEI